MPEYGAGDGAGAVSVGVLKRFCGWGGGFAPGPPFHRFFRGSAPGPGTAASPRWAEAAPPAPLLPGLRPWPPFVAASPLVLKRRTGWIGAPTPENLTPEILTPEIRPGAHFSPSGV
ncbi:hypothetical protein GCM10010357_48230 [Streptomyces luteireticuli]|uniref:Uncharacterized protein n=1 Tax=Streptomyces luteireticuli TaxID=173858 RepID=A0ABN0YYM4_9ACTN